MHDVIPGICISYRLLTVTALLSSNEPVSSFLAATLRGGFGYTLKRLVCAQPGAECLTCLLARHCAYPFLFESMPSDDASRLRKYRQIPRPFALRPRQEQNKILISLLLIGDAVKMVPFFILTLNECGKQGLGKARTRLAVSTVADETGAIVYSAEKPDVCRIPEPLMLTVIPGTHAEQPVCLEFLSPLVIRNNDTVLDTFEPLPFFTNLLRRVTNLNAFYGMHRDLAVDPRPYLDAAATVAATADFTPVHRYRISTRQRAKIDYSGITGSVTLTGDTGTLKPLIKAGEILGVGKNTVFGYGEYLTLRPNGLSDLSARRGIYAL